MNNTWIDQQYPDIIGKRTRNALKKARITTREDFKTIAKSPLLFSDFNGIGPVGARQCQRLWKVVQLNEDYAPKDIPTDTRTETADGP